MFCQLRRIGPGERLIGSFVFTLTLVLLLCPRYASCDPPFSSNTNVINSDYGILQITPVIETGPSGMIYAAWIDARKGNSRLHFSSSFDGGLTWGDGLHNNNDLVVSRNTGGDALYPAMIVDENENIYLTWTDMRNGMMNPDIYFAYSTDMGQTFSPDIQAAAYGQDQFSDVAIDSAGTLYLVWGGSLVMTDIFIASSTDMGQTWSAPVVINDTSPLLEGGMPTIAIDQNDDIYVVWNDSRLFNLDIWFAKSTDGGLTFGTNVRVNTDAGLARQALPWIDLQVDALGTIHIIWTDERAADGDYDVYYSTSTDGGLTFGPEKRIDDAPAPGTRSAAEDVAVDAAEGAVYVVYSDMRNGGGYDVRITRSTDGGATFNASVQINEGPSMVNIPRVSLTLDSGGTLHAVWHDERLKDNDGDIFYAQSTDRGDTWTSPQVEVCDDTGGNSQQVPDVAADANGLLYAAWTDTRSGPESIYLATSTSGGEFFNVNKLLDGAGAAQQDVALAACAADRLVAVWQDARNDGGDIYATRTADGGQTFSPAQRVSTGGAAAVQRVPDIACIDAATLGVVWEDYRNPSTNSAVYFARTTNGGLTYGPSISIEESASYRASTPAVAGSAPDTFYIVWTDAETPSTRTAFSASYDGGQTFTPKKLVAVHWKGAQEDPDVAVGANGEVLVAWTDSRDDSMDIYFARSLDGGASFQSALRANQLTGGDQLKPRIAVAPNGLVALTWQHERNGQVDVMAALSINNGLSFGPSYRVNDDPGLAVQSGPAVAADGANNLSIVWTDYRNSTVSAPDSNNPDIYHARIATGARATVLKVEGFVRDDPGILRIINHLPTLEWTFKDNQAGSVQQSSEVEVWDQPGGKGTALWDPPPLSGPTQQATYDYDGSALPLLDGEDYYYRVRVHNGTTWGLWNEILFHMNALAPLPVSPEPQDGSLTAAAPDQVLRWQPGGVDPDGDAILYAYEVATDPSFLTLVASGAPSSPPFSEPFATAGGTQYYWRVIVSDGYEVSGTANDPPGYWTFTTEASLPEFFALRETLEDPVTVLKPLIGPVLADGIGEYAVLDEAAPLPFTDPEAVLDPTDTRSIIFYGVDIAGISRIVATKNTALQSVDLDELP